MTYSEEKFLEPLHKALLDAFPNEGNLAQMTQFGLMKNLDELPGEGLSNRIFELIKWAKSSIGIRELAEKAHNRNPENRKLKTITENIIVFEKLNELLDTYKGQPLYSFLEKLWQIFSSEMYKTQPQIFLAFLDLIPKMQQKLDNGIQLLNIIDNIIDETLIENTWKFYEIYSSQKLIFNTVLKNYKDELPTSIIKNKIIPVILMVMNSEEAEELENGNLLNSLSSEIQQDFEELKITLLENGLDNWLDHYGEKAEDWLPFGTGSINIKDLIVKEVDTLTNHDPEITTEFFDVDSLSKIEKRQQLKKLRDKDCIVIIDSVSMCHPVLLSKFHESVLDVYSNTYVLNIAPIHQAFEKLSEMSLLIQMKIENMEFAKRKLEAEPQNEDCQYSHDTAKFGEWFSKYARKIVGVGVNEQFFK